jgi:hypothetical protein
LFFLPKHYVAGQLAVRMWAVPRIYVGLQLVN